jgi:hypothetical protein
MLWGAHLACWIQLSLHLTGLLPLADSVQSILGPDRVQLLWQWCTYAVAVCTFHLSEFFTTAIFNPTAVTANSFLVNHSTDRILDPILLISAVELTIRSLFRADSIGHRPNVAVAGHGDGGPVF